MSFSTRLGWYFSSDAAPAPAAKAGAGAGVGAGVGAGAGAQGNPFAKNSLDSRP